MSDRQIPHHHTRPTNPEYTGTPHPDPRVHGPEVCPHLCPACEDGRHHWIESGFDPDDPYWGSEDDPDRRRHNAIRATGEDNAAAHYACKHCPAWAEAEYVWDEEGDDELDGTDLWSEDEEYGELGGEGG